MQRMQSLRKGRSQRAQPSRKKQGQGDKAETTKLAKPGAGPTPRARPDARKSRVDDKIKKRMSMRYADISGPTDLAVPPMPTIGTGIGALRVSPRGRERDEELVDTDERAKAQEAKERLAVEEDKKLLDASSFDPDSYLKAKLANSTEAEIKSLQSSLRGVKEDTDTELQRNVFKNYAEFVNVSKEISTLENEMLELKESLADYKSMPSMLHIPDPTASSSSLSTYRRSSVADLRIMYFNQMQTLHSQIEGSSKLAPSTAGRHVVNEADGILALNAATYKVMGKVKFVIMDDMVLIAKKRRRTAEGSSGSRSEGKLVADKAWPLGEMLVLDTKDSPSMTNVFKIRHGKETHVYRTESPSEKKSLLSQLRQVGDELSAKRRKEREGEHERRKTMFNANDRGPAPQDAWMMDLAARAGESSGASDAKQKAERDNRWTSEWADELNVAIALKEWDKAVKLVEEGKARLAITPPLAVKLPILTTQLTDALLETLSHVSNRKTAVVHLISLLLGLGAGAAARSTFLNMRSLVMHNLVRKIKFEGHTGAYIADLALVYFTSIKHTADWFLASFKENEVASAFIDWARIQVENYAEIFRNQVYTGQIETKVAEEAMKVTYSLSRKLLEEYGLDFRFLLDEQLIEKPKPGPKPITTPYSTIGHEMIQRYSLQKTQRKGTGPIPAPLSLTASRSSLASNESGMTDATLTRDSASETSATLSMAVNSTSSFDVPVPSTPSRHAIASRISGIRPRTPTTPTTPTVTVSSPTPSRRARSPVPRERDREHRERREPSSTRDRGRDRDREREREREKREPSSRSVRSSPVPTAPSAPPPRSQARPPSVRPVPVAVAQRDGMI